MNRNSNSFNIRNNIGAAFTTPFKVAAGSNSNLFRVGSPSADTVTINGNLVVNGNFSQPDYVFEELTFPL